ncbi:SAVED domain-containing protein [Corallococcus sp. M34]|uniref:SAVED domain-containing protein n=1 Tax=Citreicoccus inhibens TaxID=2849499 RepID=UPI001C23F2F4|nr:SAVED domain-containing protein [Citreicoccus inhibens]MBU8900966.1 SAVED domain-containing protein [Citreicoccus inhibens]
MALKQVAARMEGDVFQGMVFWLNAAMLLRPSAKVTRVSIEHDQATGVDDVSVHYESPGINAGGRSCAADYFQVKYHVDRSSEYASESFCDPKFIGATRSLLQRFHDARSRLGNADGWYRLNLVSNWQWASSDKLGPLLRQSEEGALPDRFFSEGARSELGKIRKAWREHLELSEADFDDFARRLRLRVDYLSRPALKDLLNERLINVGMRAIPVDKAQNVYDSLTQQFIMSGTNSFDRQTFRAMCEREGLLVSQPPSGPPVLGIRSFMRFAERMEDECTSFVCVASNFEGRHFRSIDSWQNVVLPNVASFLKGVSSLRTEEHRLLLECHSSLAFLAGYELDRKSGAQVFPVQKGVRMSVWKPEGLTSTANSTWATTTSPAGSGHDVAIAVSVSRDALADVKAYANDSSAIGSVVDARPASGIGQRAVANADHAVALADSLAEVMRAHRPKEGGTIHLFIAAPNALAFFLGQHRGALGKVQLYEFDFEGERGGSYSPSIRLPA